MDIKQLKFLIALGETRHFGQAAARCHITQPTLSMRLRSLEEELDLPLVNRGHRFEGFTAPGERFRLLPTINHKRLIDAIYR